MLRLLLTGKAVKIDLTHICEYVMEGDKAMLGFSVSYEFIGTYFSDIPLRGSMELGYYVHKPLFPSIADSTSLILY